MLRRDIALIAVLVSADFLSKGFFSAYPGPFCNARGPWGIDIPNRIMIVFGVMFVSVTFLFRLHTRFPRFRSASLLIVAGGLGNLLDRLVFGCVRDFPFIGWFPAFNGADLLLTLGGALVAYFMLADMPADDML